MLGVLGDPRISDRPRLTPIPGGEFVIGTPWGRVDAVTDDWRDVGVVRDWIAKEAPPHRVSIADFWIGTYPVTNGEYYSFLVDAGYAVRPRHWYLGAYPWIDQTIQSVDCPQRTPTRMSRGFL